MCGLKLFKAVQTSFQAHVTPCMGVWIETEDPYAVLTTSAVTPCMGVWIETEVLARIDRRRPVTPCMGVWIETP